MISLNLNGAATGGLHVLCLGCHSDDIEIGCGGTILRLAAEHPDCVFHWVVFSAIGVRAAEAQQAVAGFVEPSRLNGLMLKTFPDGFMPFAGADIKTTFEELKQTVSPDLIFTHYSPGCTSGPPPDRRTDLEHVPRPSDPGVRNSEI